MKNNMLYNSVALAWQAASDIRQHTLWIAFVALGPMLPIPVKATSAKVVQIHIKPSLLVGII